MLVSLAISVGAVELGLRSYSGRAGIVARFGKALAVTILFADLAFLCFGGWE